MKKKILLFVFAGVAFASCNWQRDCECTFSAPVHNQMREYNIVVKDWDENCEYIDYDDIHLDECPVDLMCWEI
jgi:hypothetical protein